MFLTLTWGILQIRRQLARVGLGREADIRRGATATGINPKGQEFEH